MEKGKTELKQFLYPQTIKLFVGAVWLILGIVSFFVIRSIVLFLVLVGIAVLFSLEPLKQIMDLSRFLDSSEKDNSLPQVLRDFNCGVSMAEGNLFLGDQYIVGRGGVVPTKYDEIAKVYEYTHKTNFSVDSHMIMAKTTDKKQRIICKLPLNNVWIGQSGTSQEEVNAILLAIKNKNDAISIGYYS